MGLRVYFVFSSLVSTVDVRLPRGPFLAPLYATCSHFAEKRSVYTPLSTYNSEPISPNTSPLKGMSEIRANVTLKSNVLYVYKALRLGHPLSSTVI